MDLRRIGSWCGVITGVSFVLITFGIMLIYPGGYSFLDDPFSALGLSVTNGVDTPLNWFLFAFATTLSGLTSIPFWIRMRLEFLHDMRGKVMSSLGTIIGSVAGVCLCGVGIFAGDVYPLEHGLSTILFFILFAISVAIYSITILVNSEYENIHAVAGIIACLLCLLHIFFIHGAAMQKIAVYGIILFAVFQGYTLLKKYQ